MKAGTIYRKLDETLREMEFAEKVRYLYRSSYKQAGLGGRPAIDTSVYFKILMIGFFENLPSERAIASGCEDNLSLRAFLGFDLTENTLNHSSLPVICMRLGVDVYQSALETVLTGLYEHGLFKGRDLGIDSSIIEANASLCELPHRNTEEAYWEYVKKLAAEAGIDLDDTSAVRYFDKKYKGGKDSNEDWVNPHGTAPKVCRTKDGARAMVYQPEHLNFGNRSDHPGGVSHRGLRRQGGVV